MAKILTKNYFLIPYLKTINIYGNNCQYPRTTKCPTTLRNSLPEGRRAPPVVTASLPRPAALTWSLRTVLAQESNLQQPNYEFGALSAELASRGDSASPRPTHLRFIPFTERTPPITKV